MRPEVRIPILTTAKEIVYGDRQSDYGPPAVNHARTALFYMVYFLSKYGTYVPITPQDVCHLNILQKESREANRPTRDNKVDIAGYAENIDIVEDYLEGMNLSGDALQDCITIIRSWHNSKSPGNDSKGRTDTLLDDKEKIHYKLREEVGGVQGIRNREG